MRILITGAGGPAAISVWKSLHLQHQLFMVDIDPMASGLYLVPPAQRGLVPPGADAGFVDALLARCRQWGIELCILTVDAELAVSAARRDEFTAMGVVLPHASAAVLRLCRDKDALIARVAELGVAVPRSVCWTADAQWLEFPAFAKPNHGAGSRGLMLLEDAAALARVPRDGSYLVQEYLSGAEYSVDVFSVPVDDAPARVQVVAAVIRERMKTDSGIAVTARTLHLPDLQRAACQVVEGLPVPYVSNVQFRRASDGTFKFLEVNPRFPGTLPLTAMAGVDIPKLLVESLSGRRFAGGLLPYDERMVVRYWQEHAVDGREYDAMVAALGAQSAGRAARG